MKKFCCSILLFAALSAQAQHRNEQELIKAWEKSWNTYDLDEVTRLFVNNSLITNLL
jgi:hypothetical protein